MDNSSLERLLACMMSEPKFTYRHLAELIGDMTAEEREQRIQVWPPGINCNKPVELLPVIAFGKLSILCASTESSEQILTTCSPEDNRHHPEQWVLLTDHNEEGKPEESLKAEREEALLEYQHMVKDYLEVPYVRDTVNSVTGGTAYFVADTIEDCLMTSPAVLTDPEAYALTCKLSKVAKELAEHLAQKEKESP